MNPSIGINFIDVDDEQDGKFYPLRTCRNPQATQVTLLLIDDGPGNRHYVSVKSLNRLIGARNNNQAYNCTHCFVRFSSQQALDDHGQFSCQEESTIKKQQQRKSWNDEL